MVILYLWDGNCWLLTQTKRAQFGHCVPGVEGKGRAWMCWERRDSLRGNRVPRGKKHCKEQSGEH